MTSIEVFAPKDTTTPQIQHFFSFCGRIQRIDDSLKLSATEDEKVFLVIFESEDAKSTALLLDGAELNGGNVKILEFVEVPGIGKNKVSISGPPDYIEKPAEVDARIEPVKPIFVGDNTPYGTTSGDIEQESKPKSAVFAEYLAQGYVLSDPLLQKAVAYDNKHGVSEKFNQFLKDVEAKFHLQEKSEELDKKLGVSKYFNKALQTDMGSRIESFYNEVVKDTKQINDEAVRLAELKMKEKENEKEKEKAAAAAQ